MEWRELLQYCKTAEEFASGEVTWILNGQSADSPVWFQTLEEDSYPTLDAEHKIVYKVGDDYSNYKIRDPNYLVEYSQLSADGTTGLDFYVWLGEDIDISAYKMQFDMPNNTTILVPADENKVQWIDGFPYYGFTAPVAAKEMTMDVTAQMVENGTLVGEPSTYSVKDYAAMRRHILSIIQMIWQTQQ